jgi:hypothetical protein
MMLMRYAQRGRSHQVVHIGPTRGAQSGPIPRTDTDTKDNTHEQTLACGRESRARERSRNYPDRASTYYA